MFKFYLVLSGVCVFSLCSFHLNDEDPTKHFVNTNSINQSASVDSKLFDINSISTWYSTNGGYNQNPTTRNAGFIWPKGSEKEARYASGLWLGCVSGKDTLTAKAEYAYDYASGFVDDSGNPQTDSTYRIYNIKSSSPFTYDYFHWPVNQGAYITPEGKPYLMGDQTMFNVWTDAFPHGSGSTSIRSLKAQILQTTWAYNLIPSYPSNFKDLFQNSIFMEYRIINKSKETWNNMWLGLWTEDFLGSQSDNVIGCDTNLDIGYTYNGTNNDPEYGIAPPAVGLKFIRAGLKYTGNMNDSVKYYTPFGSERVLIKIGYKDEGLTAFDYYNNSNPPPSDPLNNRETFRVLKGLWRDLSNYWRDPVTGDSSLIPFSGDPVTGTGWIQPGLNRRRSITTTGPFTVNSGDTIIIVAAQLIARGSSNLNSITQLRRISRLAQAFYENNLAPFQIPVSPKVSSFAPGNGKIYLTWNDSAERTSYKNNFSGGTYKFEGYNIYQIKTFSSYPSAADTVLLKTFDIKDGITIIKDSLIISTLDSGFFYGIVQRGSDNGISRSLTIDRDTISNKNFIKGTEYKFAVTAYYYDSLGGPYTFSKVVESPKSNLIKVIPQSISPQLQLSYQFGDTINTDQKDLAVMPIVFKPLDLKNALYTSTFGKTGSDTTWTLTKTSGGVTSVLFENVRDFSGIQDSAFLVDGFLLIHQKITDSGIVKDPGTIFLGYGEVLRSFSKQTAWTYSPEGKEWFTSPDTNAVRTIPNGGNSEFDCRSLGMSFPTIGHFRSIRTKIFANGIQFKSISAANTILTGGPLRKIKIAFGASSMAYRFVPDTVFGISTPYRDMVEIPFSVYESDELDSTSILGQRQLNVGFVDSNKNSRWDPDTTVLGGSNVTYIFASNYHAEPSPNYTNKNPGITGGTAGLASLDVMYIWLPRVKSVNGVPLTWSNGDTLTVTPYRITRPEFVPGFPIKYSWNVTAPETGNKQLALAEVKNIKVFPNPYYGFSELQFNDNNEKFIYVSHLPQSCIIYIYTLDGVLVKKINRNQTDPNNTLEKWDLKNDEGNFVASGMYIVYVDCKELGVKTLKIAVFQNKF